MPQAAHLDELEDGKRGRAVVRVEEAQHTHHLTEHKYCEKN